MFLSSLVRGCFVVKCLCFVCALCVILYKLLKYLKIIENVKNIFLLEYLKCAVVSMFFTFETFLYFVADLFSPYFTVNYDVQKRVNGFAGSERDSYQTDN